MTPNPFAEVVVTANGSIPGQTHSSIKRLVEKCGARFEKLNINDCTHMITTQKYVQNANSKVDAALKGKNCKIVGMEWLLDSYSHKRPVNTDGYLLKPVEENTPGSSQLTPNSPGFPESKKRKFEAEPEPAEEPSKVRRNNLDVHRRGLIALVDDRYDTQGTEVALWMDERDVRWDAILINNPLKNPLSETNPIVPKHKVAMHRLQILYHFSSDKYYTWLRLVDDKTEEGELYGSGALKSAYSEFKRLFQTLTLVPWTKRRFLPYGLLGGLEKENWCIFIQPPSEEEKRTHPPWVEQVEVPTKIPRGVPGVLKLLFSVSNRIAIGSLFNEVAASRIKAADASQLDENILRTAIAILNQLSMTLAEPSKKMRTRSSTTETTDKTRQADFLKECYFGLLGIISHCPISYPQCTDVDWLKQELQDVHLLLKLRIAWNIAGPYYRRIPTEVSQQALRNLGLAEIKRVRKKSQEYDFLVDYLKLSVGSHHTVEYKEIINIFRIQRPGEAERYHKWRESNSDKIGQRCLLWHGADCEKFIGILGQGLRAGLAQKSSGGMFGAGIYFADMSGKAARYCTSHLLQVFMLLCEVEIGKDPLNLENCERNAAAILEDQGKFAVVAHGRSTHNGWMNAKTVHRRLDGVRMPDVSKGRGNRQAQSLAYNEYVVYDPAQIQQRYLFHLRTG
ncbi:hypothetical protein PEBR_01530 [Penicillium brasilianum]|uniref:Poly [ADP-ribose] polymerase n=1 Tax=Penicillium brasilianum TaxID=104259 RepID=A0A1S9S0F1_PENBI|nr:hypothetical protein PEBR_01530 [Penicillium brasilianum]